MSDNTPDQIQANRDYLIRQSEMLQGLISRMASHSLEVKKVGLTVWAAIVGFGFTNRIPALFVLAFVAFVLFGLLDIYYLFLERKLRVNSNRLTRMISGYASSEDIRWMQDHQGNFLKPDPNQKFLQQLPSTLKSWSNLPYLVTFLITIVLLIVPLPS